MKKTMTTTNETREERKNIFDALLRDYEETILFPETLDKKTKDERLINLATATAHSVLKKCIDVSYNESLIEVKRDIVKDTHTLDTIKRANNELYTLKYTEDGDLVRKEQNEEYTVVMCKGKEKRVKKENSLEKSFEKITRETLGDGLDLVNVAIIAIMEETRKAKERNELDYIFMERTYFERRLNKKVWIKLEDSVNGWEEVATTPITEVYKAVRRAIENSRAMSTDSRNGYSYIEELATDEETGTSEKIYRRLDKYSDLGSFDTRVCNDVCELVVERVGYSKECELGHKVSDNSVYNPLGKMYSADKETVDSIDKLVESLNLSMRESQVLKLRMRGYGNKSVATYLGVSLSSIKTVQKRIKQKAIASGVFKTELIEKYTK